MLNQATIPSKASSLGPKDKKISVVTPASSPAPWKRDDLEVVTEVTERKD